MPKTKETGKRKPLLVRNLTSQGGTSKLHSAILLSVRSERMSQSMKLSQSEVKGNPKYVVICVIISDMSVTKERKASPLQVWTSTDIEKHPERAGGRGRERNQKSKNGRWRSRETAQDKER